MVSGRVLLACSCWTYHHGGRLAAIHAADNVVLGFKVVDGGVEAGKVGDASAQQCTQAMRVSWLPHTLCCNTQKHTAHPHLPNEASNELSQHEWHHLVQGELRGSQQCIGQRDCRVQVGARHTCVVAIAGGGQGCKDTAMTSLQYHSADNVATPPTPYLQCSRSPATRQSPRRRQLATSQCVHQLALQSSPLQCQTAPGQHTRTHCYVSMEDDPPLLPPTNCRAVHTMKKVPAHSAKHSSIRRGGTDSAGVVVPSTASLSSSSSSSM